MLRCWRLGIAIKIPCCSRWGSADWGRAAVLSTKGIMSLISISRPPPLFLWRLSRTAAHPGVFSGLVLLVSLVSWIAAMLTLLLWRKVSSSVILPLILFAFHCISRRQLVGVGLETGPGFISISPAHWSRSRSSSAGIDRSATINAIWRVEKVRKFWLPTVSVGDPRRGNFHILSVIPRETICMWLHRFAFYLICVCMFM